MSHMSKEPKMSFETTYLRLSYAKNVGKKHIPKELYNIHSQTVEIKSFKAFLSNAAMNSSMGFSKGDFKSISLWHLTSYLSSMSLLTECKSRYDFIESYQKKNGEISFPTDLDFIKKDRSNFMSFLSQRMSDLNRIIVQNAKNVYVSKTIKKLYRMSVSAKIDLEDENFRLLPDEDLKKLGYHSLGSSKSLEVIKKSGSKYRTLDIFEVDGVMYRKIFRTPEMHSYLEDIPFWQNLPFSSLVDNQDSSEVYSEKNEIRKKRLLLKYRNGSARRKKKMLERLKLFLSNKGMKKELAIASAILASL